MNRATQFCVKDNSKSQRLKLRESEVERTENREFKDRILESASLLTNEDTFMDLVSASVKG